MLTITVESAQKAVRQVLQMFGEDHQYSEQKIACQYGYDIGRPACLVGWIVWLHDEATFEAIRTGRTPEGNPANFAGVVTLVTSGFIEFETEELMRAFLSTQRAQDACHTWGVAAKNILDLDIPADQSAGL